MTRPHLTRHWRTVVVALALVAATAGGAGARAAFDAENARRVGGYTHPQLATMSIPPQSAFVTNGATLGSYGAALGAGTSQFDAPSMTTSFVVPPDHPTGRPLTMRVTYLEDSPGQCTWVVRTDGLEGPDGPNDQPNVHNGGWTLPNRDKVQGSLAVPAGAGSVHTATFTWAAPSTPGMFIGFELTRFSGKDADTCSGVQIVGLRVSY